MNRRSFLQSIFASAAVIVVVPEAILDDLPPPPGDPRRTYVDMGRRSGLRWIDPLDPLDALLGTAPDGAWAEAIDNWAWYTESHLHGAELREIPGLSAGSYARMQGHWIRFFRFDSPGPAYAMNQPFDPSSFFVRTSP